MPHPTVLRVRILILSWLDFWSSIPRGCFLALLRLFPRSFVVAGLQPGSFSRHSSLATRHFHTRPLSWLFRIPPVTIDCLHLR